TGGRLENVARGSELLRAHAILHATGRRKDHHGKLGEFGLRAQPFQDLETGTDRQVQVEQHEVGQGKPGAVLVGFAAREVRDGAVAVFHRLKTIVKTDSFERVAHKEHVVLLVFDI